VNSVAREVATAGKELVNSLSGEQLFVVTERSRASEGAGKVLMVDGGSEVGEDPDLIAEALARAATKRRPSAILVGATRTGRIVAARLAAKLRLGCLGDVYRLKVQGSSLVGERDVFSGKVVAQVKADLPCVATVKVGTYPGTSEGKSGLEVEEVGSIRGGVRLVKTLEKQAATTDLRGAPVIIAAGRGFRKKEDLRLAEDLVTALGGALGCSRPLSSDYGWLPEELHIGLTGVTVRPSLYFALGISGQLQHVAGIKESKVIAAVNTDRDAPIFQVADYGIVGDLYQVVPAILEILKG
jgi:electron transfer flavoprotein alpha subunit